MRLVQLSLVSASVFQACAANPQAAEGCEQYSPESPYQGYALTGYKGMPERDAVWFARVRPIVTTDGTGYTMRAAPKGSPAVIYDSIEPVALGGKQYGFIARHERCSVLVDASGRALLPNRFGKLEVANFDMPPRGKVSTASNTTFKLISAGPQGVSWTVVRFVNGALATRAPHSYSNSFSITRFMSDAGWNPRVPGYEIVNVQGKFGVLRYADLREVIEPTFDGVALFPRRMHGKEAWVVESTPELALRSLDGEPIPSARFDNFKLMPDSPAGPSYVALINSRERQCHFYDLEFKSMLGADVPMGKHDCKGFDYYDGLLVFNDVDGQMQGFRLERDGRVAVVFHGTEGKYVARARNGVFIVEGKVGDATRYRFTTPAGKPLSGYDFEAFEVLGCSFIRLKKGNDWYWPNVDGTLNSGGVSPVLC